MFKAVTVRRLAVLSATLLAPILLAASSMARHEASLHLELNSAEPRINDTVATSPKVLKLWFTEPVTAPKTTVRLTNARNEAITLGKVTVAEPPLSPAVVNVVGTLPAGKYSVSWRAVGDDGHPGTGKYTFVVK